MGKGSGVSDVAPEPVPSEASGSSGGGAGGPRPSDNAAGGSKVRDAVAKIEGGKGGNSHTDGGSQSVTSEGENLDRQDRVDGGSALSSHHQQAGVVEQEPDEVDNSRSNGGRNSPAGFDGVDQVRVDGGSALSSHHQQARVEQEAGQTADSDVKIGAHEVDNSQSNGDSKRSKLEEKTDPACVDHEEGPRQQVKRKDSNTPSFKRKSSSSSRNNSLQTITINAEDVKLISNPVDAWVHRIRHDDEYLKRGLDFSGRPAGGGGRARVRIGNVGAQRLAAALSHNTRLLHLNLSDCNICYTGGVALARCLYQSNRGGGGGGGIESRTSLRRLDVSHNRVGDVGAMEFGTALRHNRSLRELDLSSNEVHFEGAASLLGGLSENRRLRKLVARDIQQTLSSDEMSKLVKGIGAAVRIVSSGRGESLEVLEMHSTADNDGGHRPDNFEGLGEGQADTLVDLATGPRGRVANVRIRRITLPRTSSEQPTCCGEGVRTLRRLLRFNAFIHPILQLHDIVNSPLAKAEAALRLKVKIPDHLRRDRHSGALLALLPSSSTRPESCSGVEYKLMPSVMSVAGLMYELEVMWNLLRYRPDVFCCAGSSMVVAPCGSCLPFGDGFCSIS